MSRSAISHIAGLVLAAAGMAGALQAQVAPLVESGFTPIFDGKTLTGWDGNPDFWRVENGEIVGEEKPGNPPKENTFLIWRGGKPADFEFKMQYKLTGTGANSGVQYRSVEMPELDKWVMKGYQADIDMGPGNSGRCYEERGRGFLALRGQVGYIPDGGKPGMIGTTVASTEPKEPVDPNQWNEMHIIARGNTMMHILNGRLACVVIDDDRAGRKMDGLIGIQLHVTKTGLKMEVKNVRLKQF